MSSLTYQYRIYPFGNQAEVLERWLGACQQLYNAALEQRRILKSGEDVTVSSATTGYEIGSRPVSLLDSIVESGG